MPYGSIETRERVPTFPLAAQLRVYIIKNIHAEKNQREATDLYGHSIEVPKS